MAMNCKRNWLREHPLFFLGSAAGLTAAGAWLHHENTAVGTTKFFLSDKNLPKAFQGFTIAQISDLHNTRLGKGQRILMKQLEDSKPDLIVITGDFLESRRTQNLKIAVDTLRQIIKLAPVYYVIGNHEARIPDAYQQLENHMKAIGVGVLHSQSIFLEQNGQKIQIIGMDDPAFYPSFHPSDIRLGKNSGGHKHQKENAMLCELKRLTKQNSYTILLSHRPDLFDGYCKAGVNLAFCGHAHGGQFRVPGFGGVYAPNQGIHPAYTEGCFIRNKTAMIVSRGLGNSLFPFRVNNPPELVVATLTHPPESRDQ